MFGGIAPVSGSDRSEHGRCKAAQGFFDAMGQPPSIILFLGQLSAAQKIVVEQLHMPLGDVLVEHHGVGLEVQLEPPFIPIGAADGDDEAVDGVGLGVNDPALIIETLTLTSRSSPR